MTQYLLFFYCPPKNPLSTEKISHKGSKIAEALDFFSFVIYNISSMIEKNERLGKIYVKMG